MLKKRIISVLTLDSGILTRTKRFRPDYRYTQSQIDLWEVDELVILDITRGGRGGEGFLLAAMAISDRCFVPISLGGGIHNVGRAKEFFSVGADKIVINTGALERPELISEVAGKYGSQAVVLSIDSRLGKVVSDCARKETGWDTAEWARCGEALGAGEILINTVEKDGSLMGYDLALLRQVRDAVSVPIIVLGGAGRWEHFEEGFEAGADACATQNIYHFTRQSVLSAKEFLSERGVPIRL